MTIQQSTDKAIINWQGFSNAAGETVRFQQPAATSATLNRVTGNEASVIQGALQANGRVFLINPNGVVFGKTARVDTAGLVASTLQMTDQDFKAGHYRLTQEAGKPLRAVVNQGQIRTTPGGSVALVAPVVNNEGTIEAPGGRVSLAAGTEAVVNLDGAGLVSVGVRNGTPGNVVVGQQAVSAMLESVVNNDNIVEAGSSRVLANGEVELGRAEGVALNQGTIKVDATAAGQQAGHIQVHGTQLSALGANSVTSARGAAAGSRGGTIHVTGQNRVGVFEGATVTANGRAGGGTVKIGGPKSGESDVPMARAAHIAAGAQVSADAEDEGDGGTVIARADRSLQVDGKLTAKGRNGFVETSAAKLKLNVTPEASTWLIDPVNILITGGCAPQNVTCTSPFEPDNGCSLTVINDCQIVAGLATGNVVIRTNNACNDGSDPGNIIWDSTAVVDFDGVGTRSLTLEAQTSIIFNGTIFDSNTGSADRLNVTFQGAAGVNCGKTLGGVTLCSNAFIETGASDLSSFTARTTSGFTARAGSIVRARAGTDLSGTIEAGFLDLNLDDATSRVVDLTLNGGTVQNNVASPTSGFSSNAALGSLTVNTIGGTLTIGANDATGISGTPFVTIQTAGDLSIDAAVNANVLNVRTFSCLTVNAPVSALALNARFCGGASGAGAIAADGSTVTFGGGSIVNLNFNGGPLLFNSAGAGCGLSYAPTDTCHSVIFGSPCGLRVGTNGALSGIAAPGTGVSFATPVLTIDAPVTAGIVNINTQGGSTTVNAGVTAGSVNLQQVGSAFGGGNITAPNLFVELPTGNEQVNLLVNGENLRGNIDGIGSGFSFTAGSATNLDLRTQLAGNTLVVGSNVGESGISTTGNFTMVAAGNLAVQAPITAGAVELRAAQQLNSAGSITASAVLLHVDGGSSELFPGGPIVPNSINASGAIFTPDLTVDLGDSANLAFVNTGLGLFFNQQSPTSGLSFVNAPSCNPFFLPKLTFKVGCGTLGVGANFGVFGVIMQGGDVRLEGAAGVQALTPVSGRIVDLAGSTIDVQSTISASQAAKFTAVTGITSGACGLVSTPLVDISVPATASIVLPVDSGTPGSPNVLDFSACGLEFNSGNGTALTFGVTGGDLEIAAGGVSTAGAIELRSAEDVLICGAVTGGSVTISPVTGDIVRAAAVQATSGNVVLGGGGSLLGGASITASGDVTVAMGTNATVAAVSATNVSITANTQVTLTGLITASGDACLTTFGTFAGAGGTVNAGGDITVSGTCTNLGAMSGDTITATGTLVTLTGTAAATAGNVSLTACTVNTATGTLNATGAVTVAANGDTTLGAVNANSVSVSGGVNVAVAGLVDSASTVSLSGSGDYSASGVICATGAVSISMAGQACLGAITASSITVSGGTNIGLCSTQTATVGDINLSGSGVFAACFNILNAAGNVVVTMCGNIVLSNVTAAGIDVTSNGGNISFQDPISATAGNVLLDGAGFLQTNGRAITAGGNVTIEMGGAVSLGAVCADNVNVLSGGVVCLAGNVSANSGAVDICTVSLAANGNTIFATGAVEIDATADVDLGTVCAASIDVSACDINLTCGLFANAGNVTVVGAGSFEANGTPVSATGDVVITTTAGDVSLGSVTAAGVDVTSGNGITMAGGVTATTGNVLLDGPGTLNANGNAISAGGNVTIAMGCDAQTGAVCGDNVSITAGNEIALSGGVAATSGDVNLCAAGDFCANGNSISATGDVFLTAGGGVQLGAVSASNLTATASTGGIALGGGISACGGSVSLCAAGTFNACTNTIFATSSVGIFAGGSASVGPICAGTVSISAGGCGGINLSGNIQSNSSGTISLSGTGSLNANGNSISSVSLVTVSMSGAANLCAVTGTSVTVSGGTDVSVCGALTATTGDVNLSGTGFLGANVGSISAAGDLVVSMGSIVNLGSVSAANVTVSGGTDITLFGCLGTTTGNVNLSGSGNFNANCRQITSAGDLTITMGGDASLFLNSADNVTVSGGVNINTFGGICATAGNINLSGSGSLQSFGTCFTASGNVDVDMGGCATFGRVTATDVDIDAGGQLALNGDISASGDFEATAVGCVSVSNVTAGGQAFVESTGGGVSIVELSSTGANITSNGNVTAIAGGGCVQLFSCCACSASVSAAAGDVRLQSTFDVRTTCGTVSSTSGDVTFVSGANIVAGDVNAGDAVRFCAGVDICSNGVVIATGAIEMDAVCAGTFTSLTSTGGTVDIATTNGNVDLVDVSAATLVTVASGVDILVCGAVAGASVQLAPAVDVSFGRGTVTATDEVMILAGGSILGCGRSGCTPISAPGVILSGSTIIANSDCSALIVNADTVRIAQSGCSNLFVNVDTGAATRLEVSVNDLNTVDLTVLANAGTLRHDPLVGELTAGGFTSKVDVTFESGVTNYTLGAIDLSSAGGTGSLLLEATGLAVTQTGALTVDGLTLDGGTFTLDQANGIARLSGDLDTATVNFTGDLIVGAGERFDFLRATGSLVLTGTGQVTGEATTAPDITAADLTLTAGAVGTAANALTIEAPGGLTATATTGGLFFQDADALLVIAATAATDIAITSGTLTLRDIVAGGDLTLNIAGDVNQDTGAGITAVDALIQATGRIGTAAAPVEVDVASLAVSAGDDENGVAANLTGTSDAGEPTLAPAGLPDGTIGLFNGVKFPADPIVPTPPSADPGVTPDPVATATLVLADPTVRAADSSVSLRTAGGGRADANSGEDAPTQSSLMNTEAVSGDDGGDDEGNPFGMAGGGGGDDDSGDGPNGKKKKSRVR